MESITVQSQMIATLAYDADRQTAFVLFKKGGADWSYAPVSREMWISWKAADSKGAFFLSHIKNNPAIKAVRVDKPAGKEAQ